MTPSIKETLQATGEDLNRVEPCAYGSMMLHAASAIERLEQALKPFATACDEAEDKGKFKRKDGGEFKYAEVLVLVADLKAARAVLSREPTP